MKIRKKIAIRVKRKNNNETNIEEIISNNDKNE